MQKIINLCTDVKLKVSHKKKLTIIFSMNMLYPDEKKDNDVFLLLERKEGGMMNQSRKIEKNCNCSNRWVREFVSISEALGRGERIIFKKWRCMDAKYYH